MSNEKVGASQGRIEPHFLDAIDLGHINHLFIDCRHGARKGALVGSMLGLLSEDLIDRFVADFNNIGLEGVQINASCKVVDDAKNVVIDILRNGEPERHHSCDHKDDRRLHDEDDAIGSHSHGARSLSEVEYIIDELEIDGRVAQDAISVYEILAQAEAAAHGTFSESVHFHEVGNDYAIASIVAFSMLMNQIGPKKVISTPITTGFGFVECAHGKISIPAPATANVLENLPTNVGDVEGELTTPTGAAIISYFADEFANSCESDALSLEKDNAAIGCGIDNKRFGVIRSIAKRDV